VTLAYEDKWPEVGDYDFNDVAMLYRVTQVIQYDTNKNQVVRFDITGKLLAYGASYSNVFAIQLPGILRSNIDDASDSLSPIFYRTALKLPWAIKIGGEWQVPLEQVDITVDRLSINFGDYDAIFIFIFINANNNVFTHVSLWWRGWRRNNKHCGTDS